MVQKKNQAMNEYERAVSHCYSTWGDRYYRDYYGTDAPYPPVHKDLIQSIIADHGAKRIIDAGCGPASIMRHLVSSDRELYGFDLTPEMIAEARNVMEPLGLSNDRLWVGSVLDIGAYSSPNRKFIPYDAAICIGVMPHIPEYADIILIERLREVVRPGGIVLLEARNELFSLFTFNRYTNEFFRKHLIDEDSLREQANEELSDLDQVLLESSKLFNLEEPPVRKGYKDEPGYDEIISRTHNPIILAEQFRAVGFTNVKPLFYHFHSLPPMFGKKIPKLFRHSSIGMEANPNDWRGYFMASAFMISATLPE